MALLDDINRLLRDHTGYTGDGQGGSGALPVGDRSTARFPIIKRDLRELLKGVAQSMGDPEALQEILDDLDDKADLSSSGKQFRTRSEMLAAGQDALPAALNVISHIDGNDLVLRVHNGTTDDPLFETQPMWGVLARLPNRAVVDNKANLQNSGAFFTSRASVAAASQESLPAVKGIIVHPDGDDLVIRGFNATEDALFSTNPRWGVLMRVRTGVTPQIDVSGTPVPHITDGSKVVLWSHGGKIGGVDTTDALARRITDRVAPRQSADGPIVPLISDTRSAPMVMRPDGADMPVSRRMADSVFAHRPAPVMSDGRTLHRWRGRMAAYRAGAAGAQPRLLLVGDSWVGTGRIPNAIAGLFTTRGYGLSADGWHPPYQFSSVTGVVVTRSAAWDAVDGSSQTEFPFGAGPDGQGVTTTRADMVLQYADLRATNIDIHSFGHGGAWRYQIDGGAWVSVTESNDGLRRITQIVDLTDEPHVLRIETEGNTGTVSIAGINSWREGVDGPQLIRFGDSGTAAVRSRNYLQYTAQGLLDLPPDLVITILGTNDQNFVGSPPLVYADYLDQLTTAVRDASPDAGILHILPPHTNAAAPWNRLEDYLPAIRDLCDARGTEYLSLYDLWGTWAQSNAAGLMNDNLHLNDAGANGLTHTLNRHFLEI